MPLKVSTRNKTVIITWENPDQSQSAEFRIRPTMTEEEMLEVLVKATTFIAKQMGEISSQIAELELEITGTTPGPSAPATTALQAPAPVQPADPSAPRIPMMPPVSLSDQPAGGPPVSTFGWSDMPTMHVPPELASSWEMIPPGER
jgi:hypothetical protein